MASTRDEIITGLKAGRTLCIDQRTAPELEIVRALEKEDLVSCHLINIDEQSTVLKVRWKTDQAETESTTG